MEFRGYRIIKEIVGKIKFATISKDANKYFVIILVEVPFIRRTINPISIDGLGLGIKDFIVTSNGEKLKNEVKIKEKRLKGLLKGLVRCKPGGKNSLILLNIYLKELNFISYHFLKYHYTILFSN